VPKKRPPPDPIPEEEPEEQGQDEAQDDATEEDPQVADDEADPREDDSTPPPRKPQPSPLDERVRTGGVRFHPTGFPGGPGGNFVPPFQPAPGMFGGGMASQPHVRPAGAAPGHPREADGEYGGEAERIEPEPLPPSDEGRARAVLGEYQDDLRVNVRVLQAGPGYNLPRGFMEDCLLSYARYPERYIPFGGKWHVEFESAATGHLLRNGRKTFNLPGPELPLNAEWRLDLMIDEQRKLKMMWDLLNQGGGTGMGMGNPNMVGKDIFNNETSFWRDRAEKQDQRLAELEKTILESRHQSEIARLEAKLDRMQEGGGQDKTVALIAALAPLMNHNDSALQSKILDSAMAANGPQMLIAQAESFNKMMEAQARLVKLSSDVGGTGKESVAGTVKEIADAVGPHIQGPLTEFIKGMNERQKSRDKMVMDERQRRDEAAARQAAGRQAAATSAPQPTAPVADTGANGKSDNRKTFDRLFKDVKQAMFDAGNKDIPAEKRPSAQDAGRKLGLCMLNTLDAKLYEGEPAVLEALGEAMVNPVTESMGNPEMFVAKLVANFGLSPEQFGLPMAASYRKVVGLPPLGDPAPATATTPAAKPVEQPVVEQVAAATTTATAAPEQKPPVRHSSTIRLPGSSPPVEPERAPTGRASTAVPAVADECAAGSVVAGDGGGPSAAAPAASPPKPSGQVKLHDGVDGDLGQPQGAVHVPDLGGEAPAADGVQAGDAEGEARQPAQDDGVGRVDRPDPAPEVEQPAVP